MPNIVIKDTRRGLLYRNGVLIQMLTAGRYRVPWRFFPWHPVSTCGQVARTAVFEFIEVFYNRQRLHSSLSYRSPLVYEAYYLS